ncbi:MAG: hypothetical protein RSD22_09295 [Romboutsia sp.]
MDNFDSCKSCKLYTSCENPNKDKHNNEELYSVLHEEECAFVTSEVKDIEFKSGANDVRLDFVVEKKEVFKLWGQVKDKNGHSVDGAFVTLLKPEYIKGKLDYTPVLTTYSDCLGFYYFKSEDLERNTKYIVTISK